MIKYVVGGLVAGAAIFWGIVEADAQGFVHGYPDGLNYGYGVPYGGYAQQQTRVFNENINQNLVVPQTSVQVNVPSDPLIGASAWMQAAAAQYAAHKDDPKTEIPVKVELVKGWSFKFKTWRLPLYELQSIGRVINDDRMINWAIRGGEIEYRFEHEGYSRINYKPFRDRETKDAQKCDGVIAGTDRDGVERVVAALRLEAK